MKSSQAVQNCGVWHTDLLGKQKTLYLGSYPSTTLAQARRKRDNAKDQLALDIDPAVEAKKLKLSKRYFHYLLVTIRNQS